MRSIARAFTLLLLCIPAAAFGSPDGKFGQARNGCSSHHFPAASPATRVCIQIPGLPTSSTYAPGQTYDVTVFVDGLGLPPLGILPLGLPVAGFNVEVTKGTLDNSDDLLTNWQETNLGTYEATHTRNGNKTNHWVLKWTSPPSGSGSVTFYLAGLAANGDNVDADDMWNTVQATLSETTSEAAPVDGLFCNPPLPLPQLLPLPVGGR